MPNNSFDFEIKSDIDKLLNRVDSSLVPDQIRDDITQRLIRMVKTAQFGGFSREYESISKYIDWILKIPWGQYSSDQLDIYEVRAKMDLRSYGLDKVKDRILEYIASMRLRQIQNSNQQIVNSPIMCFVGLQGIGKTSMAKGIGEALGRKTIRISMGGLGSTFELRGKPRTEPDAEPGQIMKALIKAKTFNPLIILDELDKISGNINLRKDFMAILLEILDPEQNTSFRDLYIDYPVDLSRVFFICTANNLSTFSSALLDRLEIVRFYSYTDEEKIVIGRDFVLPSVMQEIGLTNEMIEFTPDSWESIVRPLGFDSGIRQLKRNLYSICRKVAKIIVLGQAQKVVITPNNSKSFIDESFGVM